ncbi:MAG: type VI secretion system baseplate subunit TssF [Vitreoscilla sp.]|nr:type VI secretion system baseplate subunit TssF [Vitreoscilla sp.]
MDPHFTRLYQDELAHLKEMGGEFAREHPKIAARLALDSVEVADPYVERLLEGFAFLAARVRLKLDAEQPRLIAQLLESIYPNFLAPVPSMMVARLAVDIADPNLAQGYVVPRGSAVHSTLPRGQDTLCEFSTAHEVTLWPLEIAAVQYFSSAPDLSLNRLPPARATRGGLRIKLRAGGGLNLSQLRLDRLAFYLSAPDDVAFRLHELLLGTVLGSYVSDGSATDIAGRWRDAESVQPLGSEHGQALLPESQRSFSGDRLLQELAAMPQRLLFFEVTDLAARLASVSGPEVELVLLFGRADAGLEPLVDAGSLALHCTPAINLFRKRLDRVMLSPGTWEYHAVPDRTRPMDYEVHSLVEVQGHSAGPEGTVAFQPLYSSTHEGGASGSCYTFRREPRRPTDKQRQHGSRVPSYLGEEVFISLSDGSHGPYRESLRQLSLNAWVTNRDLPVLLPQGAGGGAKAWRLDTPGPVSAVYCMRGPTRPVSRQPAGRAGWQLVAQVTRNQIALGDDPLANAAALRELLTLHGPPNDVAWAHQAEGLRSLKARPVVRRLPFKGPLSFGNGVELELEVDEQSFQGASAFLLASVIETLLARQAAINSFTQLTLVSAQRGQVMRWPPRIGLRPML